MNNQNNNTEEAIEIDEREILDSQDNAFPADSQTVSIGFGNNQKSSAWETNLDASIQVLNLRRMKFLK